MKQHWFIISNGSDKALKCTVTWLEWRDTGNYSYSPVNGIFGIFAGYVPPPPAASLGASLGDALAQALAQADKQTNKKKVNFWIFYSQIYLRLISRL